MVIDLTISPTQTISINDLSAFNTRGFTLLAYAIKAYYDSSRTCSKFMTLAGYVGTPEAWEAFEPRWCEVLSRWPCTALHTSDAYALRGEFTIERGWTLDRVRAFILDLFNNCTAPIGRDEFRGGFVGASCTINLEDYRRLREQVQIKAPEAICVDHVVTIGLKALPEDQTQPFGKRGGARTLL